MVRGSGPPAKLVPEDIEQLSGSWMNVVERWFRALTTKKLQRSTHDSVTELTAGTTRADT